MTDYPDQTRNLNPHAEARLAMIVWGAAYAAQRGGVMDFWDKLSDANKSLCRKWLDEITPLPRAANYQDPTP